MAQLRRFSAEAKLQEKMIPRIKAERKNLIRMIFLRTVITYNLLGEPRVLNVAQSVTSETDKPSSPSIKFLK